jgi:hypothetical protein
LRDGVAVLQLGSRRTKKTLAARAIDAWAKFGVKSCIKLRNLASKSAALRTTVGRGIVRLADEQVI